MKWKRWAFPYFPSRSKGDHHSRDWSGFSWKMPTSDTSSHRISWVLPSLPNVSLSDHTKPILLAFLECETQNGDWVRVGTGTHSHASYVWYQTNRDPPRVFPLSDAAQKRMHIRWIPRPIDQVLACEFELSSSPELSELVLPEIPWSDTCTLRLGILHPERTVLPEEWCRNWSNMGSFDAGMLPIPFRIGTEHPAAFAAHLQKCTLVSRSAKPLLIPLLVPHRLGFLGTVARLR